MFPVRPGGAVPPYTNAAVVVPEPAPPSLLRLVPNAVIAVQEEPS